MAATTTLTPTSASVDGPKLIKKADVKNNSSSAVPMQTAFGCPHIKGLLQNARQQATDGYTKLINTLQQEGNITDRICKTAEGTLVTTQTTYLCLQCPSVSISRERHNKNHGFSVESGNGFVFCHECKDFVYDPTFEEIRSGNGRKRKSRPDTTEQDSEEKRLVTNNSTTTPCAATGLRGLYNMGQTCFMSVILQCLIHNPLIRTYYLCEGHKSSECDREACTSCALDDIFFDFFGQEKHEGYGAVHMLQGCWKGGGGLAGYSQQDAHEFLGFILNSLHEANAEDEDKSDAKSCHCVVHQTFGGLYKSTVTCGTCSNHTTNLEPYMDLSLDVKTTGFVTKKKKLAMINGTQTVKEAAPMDLSECLERFISAETLPSDSYHCLKCAANREAKKKLSLVRLPPTLPIHLKRFSHSKTDSKSNKVETRVRFPLTLDMTPYITTTCTTDGANGLDKSKSLPDDDDSERAEAGNKPGPSKPQRSRQPYQALYDLSCVIVHKGKIDNGHYICYCRQDEEWFRFDDSMVVHVDEKEVLGAEAYMLSYVVKEI